MVCSLVAADFAPRTVPQNAKLMKSNVTRTLRYPEFSDFSNPAKLQACEIKKNENTQEKDRESANFLDFSNQKQYAEASCFESCICTTLNPQGQTPAQVQSCNMNRRSPEP